MLQLITHAIKRACLASSDRKAPQEIKKFKQSLVEMKPAIKPIIDMLTFEPVHHCWCGGNLSEWSCKAFPLYKICDRCGCKSVIVRPTEKSLRFFYSEQFWYAYQKLNNNPTIEERYERDMSDRIPTYVQWVKSITPPPCRLLEIGCGSGRLLCELAKAGYQCSASEMDRNIAEWAEKKTGLPVFAGPFPPGKDKYDLILLIDVIEHVSNPILFVQEIKTRLKAGGKIMMHCPVIDNETQAIAQEYLFNNLSHLLMHTTKSVENLLSIAGLKSTIIGELFGMPCFAIEEMSI